jgi:hypothetical protein
VCEESSKNYQIGNAHQETSAMQQGHYAQEILAARDVTCTCPPRHRPGPGQEIRRSAPSAIHPARCARERDFRFPDAIRAGTWNHRRSCRQKRRANLSSGALWVCRTGSTPMRSMIRGSAAAANLSCTAVAHWTASTTEGNSTSAPSPMSLTIRPPWRATSGSKISLRWAFTASSVPVSSSDMSRE